MSSQSRAPMIKLTCQSYIALICQIYILILLQSWIYDSLNKMLKLFTSYIYSCPKIYSCRVAVEVWSIPESFHFLRCDTESIDYFSALDNNFRSFTSFLFFSFFFVLLLFTKKHQVHFTMQVNSKFCQVFSTDDNWK